MAIKTINPNQAQTSIGVESTFGTVAASMKRIYPKEGIDLKIMTEMKEDDSESIYLFDQKKTLAGFKSGECKIVNYVAPRTSQFTVASTPVVGDTGEGVLLKSVYGGYQAGANSGIVSATTDSVTVDDGTKFAVGQWILVPVSGQLYPAKVTAVAANLVSFYPEVASAPSSGSIVVNTENFYLTEDNTQSITVEHAKAEDSAVQYRLLGGMTNGTLKVARGEKISFEVDVKAASWEQGSLSISVTEGTNTQTAPMLSVPLTCLLQPVSTNTRVHYSLLSADIKMEASNVFIEELGGVQGRSGVARNGKRGVVEATVKMQFDQDQYDRFTAQTDLFFALWASKGSGLSKRFVIADVSNCFFKDQPQISEENGFMYLEGTLVGQLGTVHTTDLSRSPTLLSYG